MGTLQSFTHSSIFCHTTDLVGCDLLCVHEILYRFVICIPTPREVENTLLEYFFSRLLRLLKFKEILRMESEMHHSCSPLTFLPF